MTKHSFIRFIFVLTSLGASVTPSYASDVYVVRFFAGGRSDACAASLWADDILFYNRAAASATVRLLDVSNGTLAADTVREITVPPAQAVSTANAQRYLGITWAPAEKPPLWVVHLDVPDGVTIDSRDEVYYRFLCGDPELGPISAGKVSLPVFRSLVAAGTAQITLGTDLGARSARVNVAVYNSGVVSAHAHIEIRSACDNSIADARDVVVAPNSIQQFGGFRTELPPCTATNTPSFMRYARITVDQPSFSYVSVVTEELPPVSIVPPIGLHVPINSEF